MEATRNETRTHEPGVAEGNRIWSLLLDRQSNLISNRACLEYRNGLETLRFSAGAIPTIEEVNNKLSKHTGWAICPVDGIVDDVLFFNYLSEGVFPVTRWIRTEQELDYLQQPDLFHDLFGHVPLLTNTSFCNFLNGLGQLGQQFADDPEAIHFLSRFYWYTVEFGLIRQEGRICIYGAGILSSAAETHRALSHVPMVFEYNEEQILHTPYRKDQFQERYFIIDSFQKLFESLPEVASGIQERLAKRRIFL